LNLAPAQVGSDRRQQRYNLGKNWGHPTLSASVTYAQEVQRG
jgi:hypothetical protein